MQIRILLFSPLFQKGKEGGNRNNNFEPKRSEISKNVDVRNVRGKRPNDNKNTTHINPPPKHGNRCRLNRDTVITNGHNNQWCLLLGRVSTTSMQIWRLAIKVKPTKHRLYLTNPPLHPNSRTKSVGRTIKRNEDAGHWCLMITISIICSTMATIVTITSSTAATGPNVINTVQSSTTASLARRWTLWKC